MATQTFYKDIDLSLIPNVYNDIGEKVNVDAVKTTLYNNFLITSKQIPFDNSTRLIINDMLHEADDFLIQDTLADAIKDAAARDPRIKNVQSIDFTFNKDSYELVIKIRLNVNFMTAGRTPTDISLILKSN